MWTFLAWPSIRAESTEGSQWSACSSTQWTLQRQFILHYLVLKDCTKEEGADCLQPFVHTHNMLLSSSQSLIYPLNPYLSIASEHLLLTLINLFFVRLVGFQDKLFLMSEPGFLNLSDLVLRSSGFVCYVCFQEFPINHTDILKDLKLLIFHLNISGILVSVWQMSCDLVCGCIKQPQIASRPQSWKLWCKQLKLCSSCATSWNKLDL